MECHDRPWHQIPAKEIDILLRAAVGVISIDPQKANRPLPVPRQIARKRAMRLDAVLDPPSPQRRPEVFPGRLLRAVAVIGQRRRRVWVDRDDGAETVTLRDRCQPNRRLSLVAADFQNRPVRGRAGGYESEKPPLALGQESGGGSNQPPRLVDRSGKISRDRSQQNLSNAAVRSAAMSRAFRPSMLRRSSMNTSRASLNSAICGDDGG